MNFTQRIDTWLDALEQKALIQTYGNQKLYFIVKYNRKYAKIIKVYDCQTESVHAFVDKTTGDIYKPASWHAPYKDVRYNIYREFDQLINDCEWSGEYLYKI